MDGWMYMNRSTGKCSSRGRSNRKDVRWMKVEDRRYGDGDT